MRQGYRGVIRKLRADHGADSSCEHDRLEAQANAIKARKKRKEQSDLLEVIAVCHSAIRAARLAILRQYDTFNVMNELGVADFQARTTLKKYGFDPFALATAARSAETNEDLAQSEGRQSGGEAVTPTTLHTPSSRTS